MRVIVVGQGAAFSTFDTYYNYLHGFQTVLGEENVQGFATHTIMAYHHLAADAMNKNTLIKIDSSFDAVANRTARDLLLDIITFNPDALFFISGDWMPYALYKWVHRLRVELNRKFVISSYITEAPYINDRIDTYSDYFDVLFTNDKYDHDRRNPKGDKFIFHLPHSYSERVHYPAEVEEGYNRDLFFAGTMFPERIELLSKINYDGIDASFFFPKIGEIEERLDEVSGSWLRTYTESGMITGTSLPNLEVANFYRGSKISLNIHRLSGWTKDDGETIINPQDAYSYNPRINEIIACGGFPLTDFRQEIVDEYGDSVAIYEGAEDLENKIRYYLTHDDIRENMKTEARKKLKGKSYTDRSRFVTEIFQEALDIMES